MDESSRKVEHAKAPAASADPAADLALVRRLRLIPEAVSTAGREGVHCAVGQWCHEAAAAIERLLRERDDLMRRLNKEGGSV